ncbi:MAG: Asp-tRNA(Asn)/Glu-tRNA(Gln) amidotransferase subunit GatA [Candidatus Pacearchaeota archaeon]
MGKMREESFVEKVRLQLEKIKKENPMINAVLQINPNVLKEAEEIENRIKKGKAGKLAGKTIIIKANINVRGFNTSCASKTLENYKAPYNATVIEKIREEDGLILGIANMDEFACGSSGETSAFGPTRNPLNLDLIPGGSSSGSAASVAAGFSDMALGSDTGGSIRNPASHCGVVGVKPTYGLVSRYGLIDLSMSLDQIGPFAKNVDDALLLLNVIKGKDEKDPTTYESKEIKIEKLKKIKIGVPEINANARIWEVIRKKIDNIKEVDIEILKIKLPHVNLAIQTYYPLVYVEFFSGTRKFDGRRYGKKIEENCGEEVLRRILGGREISKAEYHGKYYRKALQVKELIKKEFENAFNNVELIIMPTVPKLPHKIGEKLSVEEMYSYDSLTIPANLAEIPAMSVPAGKIENIPVGLQIIAPRFGEGKMFSFARIVEKE